MSMKESPCTYKQSLVHMYPYLCLYVCTQICLSLETRICIYIYICVCMAHALSHVHMSSCCGSWLLGEDDALEQLPGA